MLVITRPRTGDLSNWPALNGRTYELALAQEHGLERRWAGDLYRVAIFSYALSAAEVEERFAAGPDDDEPGPEEVFKRGDTDASGVVDISDPIFNLTFQFVGGIEKLPCQDAADVDDSGVVDISDPIYNLTFQFVGGIAPPPPPGPTACGPEPSENGLSCDDYPKERC